MTKPIKIKLPDTHEEWMEQRRSGLGGSDAGAVLGLNPYKSAYSLWAEKSCLMPDEVEDNEAMRQLIHRNSAERRRTMTAERVHKDLRDADDFIQTIKRLSDAEKQRVADIAFSMVLGRSIKPDEPIVPKKDDA